MAGNDRKMEPIPAAAPSQNSGVCKKECRIQLRHPCRYLHIRPVRNRTCGVTPAARLVCEKCLLPDVIPQNAASADRIADRCDVPAWPFPKQLHAALYAFVFCWN